MFLSHLTFITHVGPPTHILHSVLFLHLHIPFYIPIYMYNPYLHTSLTLSRPVIVGIPIRSDHDQHDVAPMTKPWSLSLLEFHVILIFFKLQYCKFLLMWIAIVRSIEKSSALTSVIWHRLCLKLIRLLISRNKATGSTLFCSIGAECIKKIHRLTRIVRRKTRFVINLYSLYSE